MLNSPCLLNILGKCEPFVVALSGGSDSAVLLAFGAQAGIDMAAVCVDTGLNPAGELARAEAIAKRFSVPFTLLHVNMLEEPAVRSNAPDRCYACKARMMKEIREWAHTNGYHVVVDGTNADDDPADRPGMRALKEMDIISPFAECSIGKRQIEAHARSLGIAIIPSSSCLATRFPDDIVLSGEEIERVRRAETILRPHVHGRLRVRVRGTIAIIEAHPSQHTAIRPYMDAVRALGFSQVVLSGDPEGREE
jgi:uncharacterized protein